MEVEINQTGRFRIQKKKIHKLFSVIARLMPRHASQEVSVAFVDGKIIRKLNKDYRGIDKVTDVLSFAERDSKGAKPSTSLRGGQKKYLGEIIISYPRAKKQALQYGSTIHQEITKLLIHGFLHLIGHGHHREQEYQIMDRWDKKITGVYYKKR